jgi:hypothetical protein
MRPIYTLIVLASFAFGTPSLAQSFSPLGGLASPRTGVARHEGSWDRAGGNADFRAVEPGKTITLFEHAGAGVVHRFWVTIAPRSEPHIHRQAILRMYWDGEDKPAVEVPIGDFFGVGFGEQKDYISLPLNETSGGYNCYWPMPFHKSAKWTLENRSGKKIDAFYYNIDFTAHDSIPPETRTFHAHWRRENPTQRGTPYTILDTTGQGHLVGVAMFMQGLKPRGLGFLEGDELISIDGQSAPTPHKTNFVGTGTEDYFSSGWYFDRGTYSAPYHGCVIKDELASRISAYRWHIEDSIPFTKSILMQIEHGASNEAERDYSSVAYFYATGDVKPAPPLPADPAKLLPTEPPVAKHFPNAIEAESLRDSARAGADAPVDVQTMDPWPGEWSGDAQLFWRPKAAGQALVLNIPVNEAGEYRVVAHFTRAPDYGTVTARLAGATSEQIDLYANAVEPSGPKELFHGAKLQAGDNPITFTVTGKSEKSKGFFVGIDCFELRRAGGE